MNQSNDSDDDTDEVPINNYFVEGDEVTDEWDDKEDLFDECFSCGNMNLEEEDFCCYCGDCNECCKCEDDDFIPDTDDAE